MDDSLYFSEQHLAVRDMVSAFAREQVAPVASQHDDASTFPWENVKKMGELGLLGIPWSEEHGGAGFDTISFMIAIEELAKVCASHSITISAHTTLGTSPIVNFGTPDQIAKWVPLLASGKVLGGFGLTEEAAGSDAGGTKTTAVKKDGYYLLNGSKRFITHAGVGEVFVVTAVTDPSKGTKGISSFVLTKESVDIETCRVLGVGHDDSLVPMPGFKSGKKEDKLGWRASDTRELLFDNVEVPAENLLGTEGLGFVNFMKTLDAGRIGIAALSLGIAQGALDAAIEYTKDRKQFGRPVADNQGIQFMLADMAMKVEAARLMVYSAAARAERGEPDLGFISAASKCFASDVAMEVTTDAVQLFGGAGYTVDYPVERMMRDAKITQIYEGTNQIQRVVMSRALLR
jgi:butyryl-CoA dehydrogenase